MLTALIAAIAVVVAVLTQGVTVLAAGAAAGLFVALAAIFDIPVWSRMWAAIGVE